MSQSNTQALLSPSKITKILSWLRDETPQNYFIKDPRARIFLVSFSMLFFELLCIRWVPSYVRYLRVLVLVCLQLVVSDSGIHLSHCLY